MRREIPNFPGYFVDENGCVWSQKFHRAVPGKALKMKQRINKDGYYTVQLSKNGKKYPRTVHRLVLEAFVGPRPKGYFGCHGPLGSLNNSLNNLQWGPPSKNNGPDKIRDGTAMRGTRHHSVKHTANKVRKIRDLLRDGSFSQIQIAKMLNVKRSFVVDVKLKRSWGWVAAIIVMILLCSGQIEASSWSLCKIKPPPPVGCFNPDPQCVCQGDKCAWQFNCSVSKCPPKPPPPMGCHPDGANCVCEGSKCDWQYNCK